MFAFLFNFCLILQDRAWGDHWDEAIGESRELNPHIPKPDPPKEEEKVEEKKEEAEEKKSDDKKEEDEEKGDKDEKEKEETTIQQHVQLPPKPQELSEFS